LGNADAEDLFLAALWALYALWATRGGRAPASKWFAWTTTAVIFLPLLANSFGWIFTEMGRQPWTVFGVLQTFASVSPGVSAGEVWTSMIVFTLLYGALAVVEVALMVRAIKAGPPAAVETEPYDPDKQGADDDRVLYFAY
jgi:cytochrome d ubiquinol oxidase subunit I